MKTNQNHVEMPARIAALDKDARGYPIPFNVFRSEDGTPHFTINSDEQHLRSIKEGLCPICGQKQESVVWFVGEPMSAFHAHGVYNDLPGHAECIEYALKVCPYLAAGSYAKRIDDKLAKRVPKEVMISVDYTQDPRLPDVFVMQASEGIRVHPHSLGFYVSPMPPVIERRYWKAGERLSNEEGHRLAMMTARKKD